MKLSYIISIIGSLLTVVFGFYLNREVVDLRYTLSDPIYISNSEKKVTEGIQQLEVKNLGDLGAEKIQVFIRGLVQKYELTKYSNGDVVNIYNTSPNNFELIYPHLPPHGNFKLILYTNSESSINRLNLSIRHNRGIAKEALSQGSNSSILFVYGVLLFIVFIFANTIRGMLISDLERDTYYHPNEKILKRFKPFYVTQKKWTDIKEISINKIMNESFYDIDNSECYKILKSDHYETMTGEEWENLIGKCLKNLSSRINQLPESGLMKLLLLSKPKQVSDISWDKFIEDIGDVLIKKKETTLVRENFKNIAALIKNGNNYMLPDNIWKNYEGMFKKQYYGKVVETIRILNEPMKFVNEIDLDILGIDEKEKIVKKAYDLELDKYLNVLENGKAKKIVSMEKPFWMKDNDYKRLLEIAKNVIEMDKLKNKYLLLSNSIGNILRYIRLPSEKPEIVSEEEWDSLKKIENDIILTGKNNAASAF